MMENQEEIWKDIEGYKGSYQASNLGPIKSLDRFDSAGHKLKGKILKGYINPDGYRQVTLCNGNIKTCVVHRIIALTFIPNPENKPYINHKKGIKIDNRVSELEWCTPSENNKHAYDIGLKRKGKEHHFSKPVLQYNKNGVFIAEYFSQTEARRKTGINKANISSACIGKTKTAGGYIWKFKY